MTSLFPCLLLCASFVKTRISASLNATAPTPASQPLDTATATLCKLFSAKYLATLFCQNQLRNLLSTAYIKSYSASDFSKIKKVSSWRFDHKKLKDTVCIYLLANLCSPADLLTQRLKKLADVGMLRIKAYRVGLLRKKY